MALNATLNASLANASLRVFFAVRIELPGHAINLLESDGVVRFAVDGIETTFDGRDPIYGTLSNIGSITEAVATSAPTLQLSLQPPSTQAVGQLCQPLVQGSKVRVWFGNVNEATGLVIGAPELVWIGTFDTAVISQDETGRAVDIDVKSAWEYLFQAEEGQRLNPVWHGTIHPGDNCLSWNAQVTLSQPWGQQSPTPAPGQQPGGGGGNGGGGTVSQTY